MAFVPLTLLMLLSLLLSVAVAWLTTVKSKPIRVWTEHPWRVFWASYLPTIGGLLLVALGLLLTGLPLVVCGAIVMVLSAIQGLRATWHRSPWKGTVVVAVGLSGAVASVVGRLSSAGDWSRLDLEMFVALMTIAWWVVLAMVADRLARRFNARMARREG